MVVRSERVRVFVARDSRGGAAASLQTHGRAPVSAKVDDDEFLPSDDLGRRLRHRLVVLLWWSEVVARQAAAANWTLARNILVWRTSFTVNVSPKSAVAHDMINEGLVGCTTVTSAGGVGAALGGSTVRVGRWAAGRAHTGTAAAVGGRRRHSHCQCTSLPLKVGTAALLDRAYTCMRGGAYQNVPH